MAASVTLGRFNLNSIMSTLYKDGLIEITDEEVVSIATIFRSAATNTFL